MTYVWPARWNAGKVLFLLTRYPGFVDTALVLVRALLYPVYLIFFTAVTDYFQIFNSKQCEIIFYIIGCKSVFWHCDPCRYRTCQVSGVLSIGIAQSKLLISLSCSNLTSDPYLVILAMRTWVIWGYDRRVSFGLGLLLLLNWGFWIWLLNKALSSFVCELRSFYTN